MEKFTFEDAFKSFTEKYPAFKKEKDYRLFTLLAIKYMFYSGEDTAFDQDDVKAFLTDGANDGGIDAVFSDPSSDNGDTIIMQSKYYNKSPLKIDNVVAEIYKIQETLNQFKENKFSTVNNNVVAAYKNAIEKKENGASERIVFITSYEPKNRRERARLEKASKKGCNYPVELLFKSDIAGQIQSIDSGKVCVEYDELDLDKANNCLKYINPNSQNESVMVNISALSLQTLYQKRQNSLLGMNLRYYVRQNTVDDGIKKTIENSPELFWYKNNGIVIICNKFKLDGTKLKLWNFSIINGGQTTNRIGRIDILKDFYITCKVVRMEGSEQAKQDQFALDIAAASNAQKPIRKVDLEANTPEQLRLKERLKNKKWNIHYLTKKGEPKPKGVEPYQVAKIDLVGKLSLAAVMQMPGSARSNHKKMYEDEYKYAIFGDKAECGVIADLLRISYYYDKFKNSNSALVGLDSEFAIPMIRNGKTFQLACITFLCKIAYGVFSYDEVQKNIDNVDELKRILRKMDGMKQIISKNLDNEKDIFYEIFAEIGQKILGTCYQKADWQARNVSNSSVDASNYTKLDSNYYKDVLSCLWYTYNRDPSQTLKKDIAKICGLEK